MAFRSVASAKSTTQVTSLGVSVPTVSDGDGMLLSISLAASTSPVLDAPAGWTLVASGVGVNVNAWYYRTASSEPSSYTLTWANVARAVAAIEVHSNVNTSDPILSFTSSGVANAGGTAAAPRSLPAFVSAPGYYDVTTQWINTRGGGSVTTQPSGFTLDVNQDTGVTSTLGTQIASAHYDAQNELVGSGTWSVGGQVSASVITILWSLTTTRVASIRSVTAFPGGQSPNGLVTRPSDLRAKDGDFCLLVAVRRGSPPHRLCVPGGWIRRGPEMVALSGSSTGYIATWSKWLDSSDTSFTVTWSSGSSAFIMCLFVISGAHTYQPIAGMAFDGVAPASATHTIPGFAMNAPVPSGLVIAVDGLLSTTPPSVPLGSFEMGWIVASGGVTQTGLVWAYKTITTDNPSSDDWTVTSSVGAFGQIVILPDNDSAGFPGASGITYEGRSS